MSYTIISARWQNSAQTVIEALTEEAGVVLYTPNRPEWPEVSARPDIAPYEPPPVTVDQVRAEAQRRIYARFPAWKQANMTARSTEFFRLQAGFMVDDTGAFLPARALTAEEKAEEMAIRAAWEWIKAVRVSSNALEAMNPIPQDYASDARWPT